MTPRHPTLLHRRPGDHIRQFEVLEQLSRPLDSGQSQVYLVRRTASGQPPIAEVLRTIRSGPPPADYSTQQQICVLKLAAPSWEDNLRLEHSHLRRIDGSSPRLVELSSGFGPTTDTARPGPKGFGWADLRDETGAWLSLPFVLTAYYSGGSLLHLLNREQRRPLPVAFATRVALQIVEALIALQNHDLVHHDISPHNVVFRSAVTNLSAPPDCVLIDFAAADSPSARRPTRQAGKPHYLPPQRLSAREPMSLSWRIDLYSLGVVLYEMLAGDLPRRTDVQTGLPLPLPPITEHRQDLSPELVALVMSTVSHNPDHWPTNLDTFRSRLATIPELVAVRPGPRPRWALIAGAIALAIALALVITLSMLMPDLPTQPGLAPDDNTVTPLASQLTPSPTVGPLPTSTAVVRPLP